MSTTRRTFNGQFIPPRFTSDERVGLTTIAGSVIFNLTTNKMEYYNGTTWIEV